MSEGDGSVCEEACSSARVKQGTSGIHVLQKNSRRRVWLGGLGILPKARLFCVNYYRRPHSLTAVHFIYIEHCLPRLNSLSKSAGMVIATPIMRSIPFNPDSIVRRHAYPTERMQTLRAYMQIK